MISELFARSTFMRLRKLLICPARNDPNRRISKNPFRLWAVLAFIVSVSVIADWLLKLASARSN